MERSPEIFASLPALRCMSRPLAYLITFACYGIRLQGSEPGSLDRHHNAIGSLCIPPEAKRRNQAAWLMRERTYLLDASRRRTVLRAIREMVDEVLTQLSRRFDAMYSGVGRPSIAPEKLLRAQLLQMLYSIRSERLLMEEIDYSLLFRFLVNVVASHTSSSMFNPTNQRLDTC